MAELFGWVGKILKVDLSTGKITTVPTSNYVPQFIGGRALAAKLYWDEVPPECAAFDPENAVIFASGVASGTLGPGSRTAVVTKSPETVPECYNSSTPGGHWSADLKFAGFDAVVVTGKAPEPCYILIRDEKVEIKKAERLWGMTTFETDAQIRGLWGDKTRSMVIGPAGENLVRNAVILEGSHATGLGGFGAVMGSKNLKAIAVRGTGGVKIARPQALLDFYNEYVKIGGKYGGPYIITSDAYAPFHLKRLPEKTEDIDTAFNSIDSYWAKDWWLAYEEIMAGTIKRKYEGCFACPACCGFALQAVDPTGKEEAPKDLNPPMTVGQQCHEYQYQTGWEADVFDGKCMGRPAIMDCAAHQELGTTVHAMGSVHGWFKKAVELGLLTKENTGLPCGDAAALNTPAMIGKDGYAYGITYRRNDFFKRLAEGSPRFLEAMAKESADWKALYEKYIQLPRYHNSYWGGSGKSSSNMIYDATGIRTHPNEASLTGTGKTLDGFLPTAEMDAAKEANRAKFAPLLGAKSVDLAGEPKTFEDKVGAAIFLQNMTMEEDSMPMCGWAGFPRFYSLWTPDHLGDPGAGAKVLAAVTGIDRTMEENVAAMEVAWVLERAIHVREGRRREHDYYTDACFEATEWTTKEEFSKALDDYYTARGWDVDTGIPTRSQLEKLGLKDVADDLENKYGVKVPA